MTYGENKKLFMSLCDEYNPNNNYFTDDEDIQIKCALLYAAPYEELSNYRTTPKLKDIEVKKYTEEQGYEKVKMPDCKKINSITVHDKYNNPVAIGDYKVLGNFLYLSNVEDLTYTIEYIPYLTMIDESTSDDFELEIPQDLQTILPYLVASDLFKTDPGQDWTAFEQALNRKLQMINYNKMGASANITEGVFD